MRGFWERVEQRFEAPDDPLPILADVAIALGYGLAPDGKTPSPQSAANARKAADLFLEGKARGVLLVGGGTRGRGATEAEAMANSISGKVPRPKILLETESKNTVGNADNSLRILVEHGWRTAIVVCQQWHARRVRAVFRKRWNGGGIEFVVAKARSPYGGPSQAAAMSFPSVVLWDTLGFVIAKLKGQC